MCTCLDGTACPYHNTEAQIQREARAGILLLEVMLQQVAEGRRESMRNRPRLPWRYGWHPSLGGDQ